MIFCPWLLVVIFFLTTFEFIDNADDWVALETLHFVQDLRDTVPQRVEHLERHLVRHDASILCDHLFGNQNHRHMFVMNKR